MGRSKAPQYERQARRLALTLAVTLHLAVVVLLSLGEEGKPKNQLQPLTFLEFAYFDPEGANPGDGNNDKFATMPELKTLSPATTEPEMDPKLNPKPEPELSPEADQISKLEALKIIDSVSSKITPLPLFPPPQPLTRPKSKPKLKPKTKLKPRLIATRTLADADSTIISDAVDSQTQFGYGPGQSQGGTSGESGGHGNPNVLNAYKTQLLRKLNRYKKYPPKARSQGVVGTVLVNFTVNRQGAVLSSHLARSSGNIILNQEALTLLQRVSPFPAIPKEVTEQTLNITAPVQFTIDANSPLRKLK